MAVFNVHPFDSRPGETVSSVATFLDRLRFFGGGVFTPSAGVAIGVGGELLRGFSFSAGYGVLRVDVLRPGDEIGTKPSDINKNFDRGWDRYPFIGFGFKF